MTTSLPTLEQELYSAGVAPAEVEAGARRLLAEARGHQLAEERKQYGLAQRDVAARMGVSCFPLAVLYCAA
ncbi:hypothetical protein ACH40F_21755 [Streptomyces sp. NPDC020794]|uniref:hypothetical protein n=1 Tax=unclassified Streptomyces TaxID=2593676 RepID=UPI0036E9318B